MPGGLKLGFAMHLVEFVTGGIKLTCKYY